MIAQLVLGLKFLDLFFQGLEADVVTGRDRFGRHPFVISDQGLDPQHPANIAFLFELPVLVSESVKLELSFSFSLFHRRLLMGIELLIIPHIIAPTIRNHRKNFSRELYRPR